MSKHFFEIQDAIESRDLVTLNSSKNIIRTLTKPELRIVLESSARLDFGEPFKIFAKFGIDIHSTDDSNNTLLFHAAKFDSTNAIAALIAEGLHVNAVNVTSKTPLCTAVLFEKLEAVKTLLDLGANPVYATEHKRSTPLHLAANTDHCKDIIRVLISHGADVNTKNKYGDTAIAIAAKAGYVDNTLELLEHGANFDDIKQQDCTSKMKHVLDAYKKSMLASDVSAISNGTARNKRVSRAI